MAAHSQTADSGPVREPARIISLDRIRGVAVLGILLMNAVNFKLGRGPYFNLSAGGSETLARLGCGLLRRGLHRPEVHGAVFAAVRRGNDSLHRPCQPEREPGSRAEPVAKRAAAADRRPPLPVVGRRCSDGLCGIVGLSDRPAKAAELDAHLPWSCRVRAVCCQRAIRTAPRRHDQRIAVRSLGTGRGLGPGPYCGSNPSGLLPARLGADSRRRRPVSHRLHERRLAGEDVSTDRDGRACRRPAACRRRRHHHRGERLTLARSPLSARFPTPLARFPRRWGT